jgi:hypothetical protein
VGDNVGSYQADELKSHLHSTQASVTSGAGSGAMFPTGGANIPANSGLTGGSTETRPKNAYVNYIMKAQ